MSVYITIVCDSCDTELKTNTFSISKAEQFARENGWDAGRTRRDYCEKCKPHVFNSENRPVAEPTPPAKENNAKN